MTLFPVLSAVFQSLVDIDYWNLGLPGGPYLMEPHQTPILWPTNSSAPPPPLSYRSEEGVRIEPVDEPYPLCHMIAWNIPGGPRGCCNEGSDGM
jgi:hypothetical protein